jgi:hypothetical protein
VVLVTLKKYINPFDLLRATQAFLRYYTRRGPFSKDHANWAYAQDPVTFWQLHFDDNNALSQLADRFLQTLANSVPCERHFSALNHLHNKARNHLTPERVNKLLYIQINRRTLRRERSFTMLSEEEEEEDTVYDAGEDATSSRLAHITEAKQGENASMNGSNDELV